MSVKSRADIPRRAGWYASAADPALATNRDHFGTSAVTFTATSLSHLHVKRSAIGTPTGTSRARFRHTQLSLQEAGSGIIGFGPGSRQYGSRSGWTKRWFRLGSRRQFSQSPSHICSGRFLNDVAMTIWLFQSGWVKIRRNAEEKKKTKKDEKRERARTLVPRFNSSRANGKTPRMTSSPLLSTNIAAHRWAPSSSRTSQSSTWSMNHGLSKWKNVKDYDWWWLNVCWMMCETYIYFVNGPALVGIRNRESASGRPLLWLPNQKRCRPVDSWRPFRVSDALEERPALSGGRKATAAPLRFPIVFAVVASFECVCPFTFNQST